MAFYAGVAKQTTIAANNKSRVNWISYLGVGATLVSAVEAEALIRFLRPRAYSVLLTLRLRLERFLEVLGVNACFCPLYSN